MNRFYLIVLFVAWFCCSHSQNDSIKNDSLARKKAVDKAIYSKARKAAIFSAILPGAGQAYNQKYWKIPVIYAGIGGLAYFFRANHREFIFYRDNLRAEADSDSLTINNTTLDINQLQSQKIYYRKFRDFAVIGIGIIYLLNIADANVDAHLKTFDVSDDLGLQLKPFFMPDLRAGSAVAGLTLKLKFKR